jgi:prepilin-type N-terminal cleavage/methylation domain-containing protein
MFTGQQRMAAGFTLVEVMVSLVIFLFASMALLPLLVTTLKVNHENALHDQARRLASEVMAELQVVDYGRLATIGDTPLLFAEIEIQRQVEQSTPPFDQTTITVTAHWEGRGREHRYQLQTVRSAP